MTRTNSRTHARCGLAALALACAVQAVLAVPHARADEALRARASALFRNGVELADRGEYRSALAQFEQAYRLSPHPSVLYNIGLAWFALDQPVRAIAALRGYLEQSGARAPADQRARAEQQLGQALLRVGRVRFAIDAPQPELQVDGAMVDPARELALLPGPHALRAAASGRSSLEQSFEVEAGSLQTLVLALAPLPQVERAAPALGEPARAGRRPALTPSALQLERGPSAQGPALRTWAWASGAAGLGLAFGSLAVFVWNDDRHGDWEREDAALGSAFAERPSRDEQRRQHTNDELLGSIERWDAINLALLAGGAVLLATSGVLWFAADTQEARSSTARPQRARSPLQLSVEF